MSAKMNNDSNRTDIDFSALDRELAQMAAETPEVPADFHAKWVGAIREEAAKHEDAESDSGRATETGKMSFLRQRRYLLSTAAAFIILIGGVIAYTQSQPKQSGESAPTSGVQVTDVSASAVSTEEKAVAAQTAELSASASGEAGTAGKAAADMEETGGTYDAAEYSAAAEPETAYGAAEMAAEAEEPSYEMNMAAEAGYDAYAEAEEDAGMVVLSAVAADSAGESSYAPPAGSAMKVSASREEAEAERFTDMEAAEEAEEPAVLTVEYAAEAKAAEESAPATMMPAPAATGTPAPEATREPEETTAPEATMIPEEEAAMETNAAGTGSHDAEEQAAAETEMEPHSFLQSVWSFILTITPWLLGATIVILFIAAYVVNIEKRRERKNK